MTLGKPPVYQGPVDCIATIVRTEGLAGMYRGFGAMLLRDVPGYCLYFIPYVFLNDWITPEACAGPSLCAVWLAGGVAGKGSRTDPCACADPLCWEGWGAHHALLCPREGHGSPSHSSSEYLVSTCYMPDLAKQRKGWE